MNKFLICLTCLLLLGCAKEQQAVISEILRPVKYEQVTRSGGKNVYTFSGVAQSDREANLSFRVAGTVRSMHVKLGERVRKGQLIATIDPSDYTIQADQASASEKGAEANLKSAETQLIIAKSNYERIEKLYENNSVPLTEFEQAKSNYEQAQSNFEAAQTQVTSANKQTQSAKNQVAYTRLKAPFNGVITSLIVEANELVGSGSPVAVLSSEKQPEVNVGIPENLISKIKKDQPVTVHFSVLEGEPFKGHVHEVSYAAGSSPTYPAIIRIDNPSDEIRPGMAAAVTFGLGESGDKSLLLSPVQAIGEDAKGNFTFVLQQGDSTSYVVKRRTVEIGELLPEGFEIKNGLEEGELVATAGLRSLLDGMKVRLMDK
jgi:RND family efflux transporter MFP subunit